MARLPFPSWLLTCALLAGVAACDSSAPPSAPPAAPAEVTATAEAGTVTLAWSAADRDALAGYNVYRSSSSFSDPGNAQKLTPTPTRDTRYRDDEAENGTTFYYRVTALDEAGNESALSEAVAQTLFPPPPGEP